MRRGIQAPPGVLAIRRALESVRPRERGEAPLTLDQGVAGTRTVTLDPEAQVAVEPKRRLAVGRLGGAPVLSQQLPASTDSPLVYYCF